VSKEIDKLIEQVLNEKGIDLPFDLGGKTWTPKAKKTMPPITGFKKDTVGSTNWKLFQKLLTLAKNAKSPEQIESQDLQVYLNNNQDPEIILAELEKEIKSDNRPETVGNLRVAFQEVENGLLNDKKLSELFNSTDREQVDRGLRALNSINGKLKSKAGTIFKQLAAASSVSVAELHQALKTGTIKDVDPSQQPFGRSADPSSLSKTSMDTTGSDFKEGIPVEADRNLVNQFRSIEGDSILGKLEQLKLFGEAVNGGKPGINTWLQSHNQFELINYSAVLAMLADIPREYSAIESGYQFERWLALFMNIPIVGGENGMADNLGQATDGGTIYTSAKMYANACGVSQALANFEEHFKTDAPVYYFVMEKKGEKFGPASNYTSIAGLNCYLVKISKDDSDKPLPYVGQLIGPNGTAKTKQYPLKMKDKLQVMLMPCSDIGETLNEEYAFFSIPTLPNVGATPQAVNTTAEYFASEIRKSAADISIKILDAYKSLQKVEQDTDNYRSVKGKGKDTVGTSSNYIKSISKNYGDYKNLMNSVFDSEKETEKISESHDNLDSLIETIIKQTLLK
tara:strand:+ start:9070 stop:10773 length:1704 start_codon:yes stop_codon:yes gene_type:complete